MYPHWYVEKAGNPKRSSHNLIDWFSRRSLHLRFCNCRLLLNGPARTFTNESDQVNDFNALLPSLLNQIAFFGFLFNQVAGFFIEFVVVFGGEGVKRTLGDVVIIDAVIDGNDFGFFGNVANGDGFGGSIRLNVQALQVVAYRYPCLYPQ